MDMKRYAVFAKKTAEAQNGGDRAAGHENCGKDYTIWHFLNDTDDANEAYYWYYHAKQNTKTYADVQIVESIHMEAVKI